MSVDQNYSHINEYNRISVSLASPNDIRSWSYGEVKTPETINYRSYRPEKDGLFCEKIFGPERDWECSCGKFKGIKYKDIICDRCGVKITHSKVRRSRMGHINLSVPVVHIWFFRAMPSRLGILLDVKSTALQQIIYFQRYVVTDPGETPLKRGQILSEEQYREEKDKAFFFRKFMLEGSDKASGPDADAAKNAAKPGQVYQAKATNSGVLVMEGDSVKVTDASHGLSVTVENRITAAKDVFSNPQFRHQFKLDEREKDRNKGEVRVGQVYRSTGFEPKNSVQSCQLGEFDIKLVRIRGDVSLKVVGIDGTKVDLLVESEWHCGEFIAQMGAEAVRELIRHLDIQALEPQLRAELAVCTQKLKTESLVKRLRIVQSLLRSGNDPAWMTMDVIPVIPPDLRPLVPLDSGNFATSDLNDLYRRVIYRNNRLSKLLDLNAPNVIVRNEKRMLQQAVDSLFDNSRCKRPVQGAGNRPLKSLTDMIKGKQGRFRANLLGKRVDYSARSVIIVGPELRLDQVGLPKKIALELFQPFIIRKLKERGLADTIKSAKTMLERKDEEIWDVLEEVIEGHPVLLNRAPTLHRMGIQAFYPVLVEGDAIRIHPLVCAGFNADFDGDQMAVHLPLTVEATAEASMLMISTANIFSPAHGNPIITADLDIVLGCYYLTLPRENAPGEGKVFRDFEEVLLAYDEGRIHLGTKIKVRPPAALLERDEKGEVVLDENGRPSYRLQAETTEDRMLENGLLPTTAGRILFYDMLPRGMMFYNRTMNKKSLNNVVSDCHLTLGRAATVRLLDSMKETGFHYATLSGVSFSAADLTTPTGKPAIIKDAEKKVATIEDAYQMGDITDGERYNQIVDIWTHVTEEITNELLKELKTDTARFGKPYLNPVWAMFDSKARGSTTQIRQLAGFRGLMTKPNGRIIETPIRANFREGLRGLEYFSSTHGARKGLADTALKTADSGYLTRKLVEVAQDATVLARDCGTHNGVSKGAVTSGEHIEVSMADNIFGRISAERIRNPVTDEIIVDEGDLITREAARRIEDLDLGRIRVRSPLTCELDYGICANCYGMDLSTGEMVETGLAVGIIAAQSIGEPGTQLTMRTFHIGGVAATTRMDNELRADVAGTAKFLNLRTVRKTRNDKDVDVVLNRNGAIVICDEQGRELCEPLDVIGGATLLVKDGQTVKARQSLAVWDAFNTPLLTEKGGIIRFEDVIEGQTMRVETDASGFPRKIISEHKGELHPQVIITDKSGVIQAYYSIPEKAHLQVDEGEEVAPGDVLARTPREMGGTQDITGGLPRVTELFEARKPKDPAVMAEVDGEVELGARRRGKRIILVKDDKGDVHEHLVPHGKHVRVHTGDRVRAGESLVDGPLVPHDILRIKGEETLREYLLNEVQKVYRAQNVRINDKHIEILIRQMLNKVQITDPGDTDFLVTDAVSKPMFHKENARVLARGGTPATCEPILQGIARASLSSDSVIAAASFQETTKVLTDAAIAGRDDHLRGLKENVLIGRMIPAGTGSPELLRANIRFADGATAPRIEEVEPEDELSMDLEKALNS